MAKQHGNQAGAKLPLSRHPLFPAMVALWFGALFGLGSLAIRTSLLEALVLSTHLDAVLEFVAPPLGMKARIILALCLAVLGGMIGAAFARRLARPKPERRERKRKAAPARRSSPESRLSEPVVAAPLDDGHQQDETGRPDDASKGVPFQYSRRRSLAVEQDYEPEYARDAAPLPGASPQILDVTKFDFAASHQPEGQAGNDEAEQTLDLGAFVAPDAPFGENSALPQEMPHTSAPAPVEELPEMHAGYKPTPYDMTPPQYSGIGLPLSNGAEISQAGQPTNHPGDVESTAMPANSALPRFALPSAEQALFGEPVEVQPEREAAEVRQVFADPLAQAARVSAAGSPPVPEVPVQHFGAAESSAEAPEARLPQFAAPIAADEPAGQPEAPSVADPQPGSAASRISGVDLGDLSHVELIERLALSLQRRRETVAAPPVAVFSDADTPAPADASRPAGVPFHADFAQVSAELPEPAAMQTFMPEAEAPVAQPFAAPPSPQLPQAMRPLDPVNFEPEGDIPDFAFPRQVAVPSAIVPDERVEAEEPEQDEALEEGYSSLLDLNRPTELRQQFIRIEEPEPLEDTVEPVVVFPGQAARSGARFGAPDFGAGQADQGAAPFLRRFDQPGEAANQPTPFAPAPVRDPEETQRALRSALATLQRMSGAA